MQKRGKLNASSTVINKKESKNKNRKKIWVCSERSAQPGVVQGERWCQQLLIHTSQCSAFQRLVSIWGLPFRDLTFQLSQAWSCHPVILQIALTCTLTFEKVAGLEDLRGPLWCESRGPELWCILSGEAVQGKPQYNTLSWQRDTVTHWGCNFQAYGVYRAKTPPIDSVSCQREADCD